MNTYENDIYQPSDNTGCTHKSSLTLNVNYTETMNPKRFAFCRIFE